MATHTLVVEFDGDGPTYAAEDPVLGGRLVAVDFGGDRLAVADDLLKALKAVEATEMFLPDHPQRQAAYKTARAAIAKATQQPPTPRQGRGQFLKGDCTMLSRKDAIKVAQRVVERLKREESLPGLQGPDNKARYAARGLAAGIIDEIWFDLPDAVRQGFGWDSRRLFDAAGWQ